MHGQIQRPMIATVAVDGPAQVTIGQEGDFNVTVTYNKAPYPSADISRSNTCSSMPPIRLSTRVTATLTADGSYKVALTSDITKADGWLGQA